MLRGFLKLISSYSDPACLYTCTLLGPRENRGVIRPGWRLYLAQADVQFKVKVKIELSLAKSWLNRSNLACRDNKRFRLC